MFKLVMMVVALATGQFDVIAKQDDFADKAKCEEVAKADAPKIKDIYRQRNIEVSVQPACVSQEDYAKLLAVFQDQKNGI